MQAEYQSLGMTVSEAIWLKGQLKGLGFCHTSVIQIYCDNTSTIQIAKNRIFHKCNKHTEINCHFIRIRLRMEMFLLIMSLARSKL